MFSHLCYIFAIVINVLWIERYIIGPMFTCDPARDLGISGSADIRYDNAVFYYAVNKGQQRPKTRRCFFLLLSVHTVCTWNLFNVRMK